MHAILFKGLLWLLKGEDNYKQLTLCSSLQEFHQNAIVFPTSSKMFPSCNRKSSLCLVVTKSPFLQQWSVKQFKWKHCWVLLWFSPYCLWDMGQCVVVYLFIFIPLSIYKNNKIQYYIKLRKWINLLKYYMYNNQYFVNIFIYFFLQQTREHICIYYNFNVHVLATQSINNPKIQC